MSGPRAPDTFYLAGHQFDLRTTGAAVTGTLLLTVDFYFRFLPATGHAARLRAEAIERIGFYLLIPLGLIWLIGDRPRDYGCRLGHWRPGLALALASFALAAPALYLTAKHPSMVTYYGRADRALAEMLAVSALDLLGWEFFFRGFLLFVLSRQLGPTAIIVQAVPFALAHLGKPAIETLTTIFGGAYFGWIAWRTGSFLYPFLLHWLVNVFVYAVAAGYLSV